MSDEILLELKDITKSYPGVLALDHVSMDIRKGEVHVLIGENGAGKSTLIKILSGAITKDSGEILLQGEPVEIPNPVESRKLGIATIYQELSLVPRFSVAENVFLGRELRNGAAPILDRKKMRAEAKALLQKLGISIDPAATVGDLGLAQQQTVEIAKALSTDARLIIMDEPTSSLSDNEILLLHDLVRSLKSHGVSVIYISHRLEEVPRIGDRVTVLRDGRVVATLSAEGTTPDSFVSLLVGRELKGHMYPERTAELGDEVLSVEGLTRKGVFEDVSFVVHKGEILGVAGLVGSGRTEVARTIFGADRLDRGVVHIDGQPTKISSPGQAIGHGIGFLTEDRKGQGLVLGLSVADNVCLATLASLTHFSVVSSRKKRVVAQEQVRRLSIKTPSINQLARLLSGGNQQKVVLAKWLCSESKVLIFDEPTRGIDVGAKNEIYTLMAELTERGVGIVMISSELPEILGMSDRVLVMAGGRVTGCLPRGEATEESVLNCAMCG